MTRREFLGEVLGTFILVFFGIGSVAVAVATSIDLSLWQIASIWGLAVMVAIYVTGPMSGAHLHPAITIAFACWDDFPWRKIAPYIGAQLLGAMAAALMVFVFFEGVISNYEASIGIERGKEGSEATAMIFGEYYPNPGGEPIMEEMSLWKAFWWELWGTTALAFGVFAAVGFSKKGMPNWLVPIMIGVILACLIYVIAPVTQAGFNPARDFGPRLFSAMAGWGSIPSTTNPWGWWLVYLEAPALGGIIGGGLWRLESRKSCRSDESRSGNRSNDSESDTDRIRVIPDTFRLLWVLLFPVFVRLHSCSGP